MLFRIGRDRDLEIADALDRGDEFGGCLITVGRRFIGRVHAARRVAAQGHDVANARGMIFSHDGVDLGPGGADTGEMRSRRHMGIAGNARHRRMGAGSG